MSNSSLTLIVSPASAEGEDLKRLGVVETAKRVRAEIKALQASGTLPKGKISVKTDKYSMGCSLTVRVVSVEADLFNPSRLWHEIASPNNYWDKSDYMALDRSSAEGERVEAVLEAIVAPYHRDDSDSMTDCYNVNFHKSIDVFSSEQRAVELARLKGG